MTCRCISAAFLISWLITAMSCFTFLLFSRIWSILSSQVVGCRPSYCSGCWPSMPARWLESPLRRVSTSSVISVIKASSCMFRVLVSSPIFRIFAFTLMMSWFWMGLFSRTQPSTNSSSKMCSDSSTSSFSKTARNRLGAMWDSRTLFTLSLVRAFSSKSLVISARSSLITCFPAASSSLSWACCAVITSIFRIPKACFTLACLAASLNCLSWATTPKAVSTITPNTMFMRPMAVIVTKIRKNTIITGILEVTSSTVSAHPSYVAT
mmetsp:Transcript_41643/g.94976  ORF Transcript_41643/g.94976 Transcript_41643/m.94976 type:complete len:266 (+) Transcript_41643:99-896(+)